MSALPHTQENSRGAVNSTQSLALCCPRCQKPLCAQSTGAPVFETSIACRNCAFVLTHEKGIWLALPPERMRHYERFLTEYQIVRAVEGRGSTDAAFYVALPFRDVSGRNQSQWKIRAQTFRYLERLLPRLKRSRPSLDVLDLGAGNGWLSYRLALLGHQPVAVDLLTNSADGLGAATHYLQKLEALFPRFQSELDRLPFGDAQFDCAVFNASFHYSEDYKRTLAEAIRCLRPRGTVVIADTPWYRRNESGQQMIRERRAMFQQRFGFPSDGLSSLEYLTDDRLRDLEEHFGIRWQIYSPNYGLKWVMRPLIAGLNGKREPSKFRIYVAEVNSK